MICISFARKNLIGNKHRIFFVVVDLKSNSSKNSQDNRCKSNCGGVASSNSSSRCSSRTRSRCSSSSRSRCGSCSSRCGSSCLSTYTTTDCGTFTSWTRGTDCISGISGGGDLWTRCITYSVLSTDISSSSCKEITVVTGTGSDFAGGGGSTSYSTGIGNCSTLVTCVGIVPPTIYASIPTNTVI